MPRRNNNIEKKALWEIRRRYNMNQQPAKRQRAHLYKASASPAKLEKNSTASAPLTKNVSPKRKKGKWTKRILILLFLLVLIAGGVFSYKIIAAGDKISTANRSILGQIKDLLFKQGKYLQGEQDGQINILIIAIGGEGHKGRNLADTIMIASFDPASNKASLLSIPRDLYVQVSNEEYYSKINAIHAYGESRKKDAGPELLRGLVEEITGLPIHYYVRVDFTAFKTIVDAIGGINITIDNSFYDYWHKIAFQAGTEKMNGERALAYVRARYIEGPEGGDFKRAARQQQVLLAVREKVFSYQTALDFTRINLIINSLSDNIRTDMHLWEMKRAFEFSRLLNPDNVQSKVLTTGPKGVLTGGTEVLGGVPASVLRPRTGDYSEIRNIAQHMLDSDNKGLQTNPPPTNEQAHEQPRLPAVKELEQAEPKPEVAKPNIEIRNATNINGLAKRTSDKLSGQGYDVTGIGNANKKGLEETIVYIISPNHAEGAKVLADLLSASVKASLPETEKESSAQALVLLGENAE